jgi:uncharacterized membrane protein
MIPLLSIHGWSMLYPLLVHLPAALLLVAPLFVVLGLASRPPKSTAFFESAWIIMVLGTILIFLALAVGEAAASLAGPAPQVKQLLREYEEVARTTGILFSLLTVVFTALLIFMRMLQREISRELTTAIFLAFLLLYTSGALFLANTAHQGGRLVQELSAHTLSVRGD